MRPFIAIDVATGWWDSTTSTLGDWWEWIASRLPGAGRVMLIVVGALVVWILGRLLIRAATRGIRDGISRSERHARRVLRRANLPIPEPTIHDRLEETRRAQRSQTISGVLKSALTVTIVIITMATILAEIGLDVGPIIAAAGIVGVALGFGAQSLVKDLLSGMFMLIEDQYGVGDVIDTGEATGLVEEVGLRATRLRALDGTVWFVPNGEIRRVGNMSQLYSRAKIEVRFAFDVDIEAAREAMLDAARMARADAAVGESIIGEPEVAGVEEMDYNSVTLRLLLQTKPITQWSVMRAIRANMRDIFLERGIPLAAPEGALLQPTTARPSPTVEANTKPSAAAKRGSRTSSPSRASSSPRRQTPGKDS